MTARRATRDLWCSSCDSAGTVLCHLVKEPDSLPDSRKLQGGRGGPGERGLPTFCSTYDIDGGKVVSTAVNGLYRTAQRPFLPLRPRGRASIDISDRHLDFEDHVLPLHFGNDGLPGCARRQGNNHSLRVSYSAAIFLRCADQLRQPRPQLGRGRHSSISRQLWRQKDVVSLGTQHRPLAVMVAIGLKLVERNRDVVRFPRRRLPALLVDLGKHALNTLGEVSTRRLHGLGGQGHG